MKKNSKAMWLTYSLLAVLVCAVGIWRGNAIAERVPNQALPSPYAGPISATDTPPALSASPVPVLPAPSTSVYWKGQFELPIEGATGYATIDLNLRSAPSEDARQTGTVSAGTGFRIAKEEGRYWYVVQSDFSGYVAHRYCMINLPDILPSIIYENTNASASVIRSSGKPLPGITGVQLYDGSDYSARFDRQEFIMPVLYEMAKKINAAQQNARAEGNSLKLYEAYRPYAVQRKVVNALNTLAEKDKDVMQGISATPWKVSWFASQGTSNHQRGCAIDASLVQVKATQRRTCGPYAYLAVTEYSEYTMPTAMHELSAAAAAFLAPVSSSSQTAWRSAAPAADMNNAAKALQRYCTDAGLTPLASEWWHFNDLDAYDHIKNHSGEGGTVLNMSYSKPPST